MIFETRKLNKFMGALQIPLPKGSETALEKLEGYLADGKTLTVEIKLKRARRSLDANACMWGMLRDMATVLHTTDKELYLVELEKYGVCDYISCPAEAVERITSVYRLVIERGTTWVNGYKMKVSDKVLIPRFETEYLVDYFKALPAKKKENIVFCFYHGCFVIYLYGNEEDMIAFKVGLSDATTNVARAQNLKVYARPIFGIKLVDEEKDLFNNMDDASIARNISERNYDESTIYSPSFRKATTKEEIEEIEDAIKNNEFVVYYQPKYLLSSKTFNSAEALVRWNSKVHGLVAPGKFINKAELGGLIHELDIYVFRQVCRDLADQKKRGRRILPVSVNFSQYEFYSPSFLQDIDTIMKEFNIEPYNIHVEITEPTARKNEFMTIAILNKLKAKGIKIAMDDYGIGYSNLANLNKLPFDTVKIDKSYIDGIVTNVKTREIVKLLINFCHANGIEVVAEGVDSADQVDILKKIKCDTIQGYYFSKPVPRTEYEKLVSKSFQALDKEER